MDTTTMETLLYSWLPVLVIIGAWFLGMFLARRNRRGLFLGLSATPVLNDKAEVTQALKGITDELREIRAELSRLAPQ